MKKKLVVYLAGLLTVLGLGFGQAQFSDVPAGHWAKEAVERIAACGLITGFPDGTFRGNTNLTRYQAALIFQRLLTELQQGGECVGPRGGSLSEEDLAAIRNAVQELAAELAALGVRVSALEDNAASKDEIARLEAAIEELKAMKAEPAPSGMDEAALADLADRVEAASVAADTALAQAQVLAERLDAVEGDVAALKTQVEADSDSIRALNELAVLLNQDVLSLQDRVTALEKQLGDVDFGGFANREDVSAIQEFATALRGDLVRLSEKVGALSTSVDDINKRVGALESVKFTLSGNISATYGYATAIGPDFDIDRLFSDNQLSSGSGPEDSSTSSSARQGSAVSRGDFNQKYTDVSGGLNFGLKFASGDISEVSVSTKFSPSSSLSVKTASIKGNLSGQNFTIQYDSSKAKFRFNPYLFSNNTDGDVATRPGVVATLNATSLPLSPNFTVVVGSGASTDTAKGGGNTVLDGDYFGTRAEVNLLGLKFGLSYAERNSSSGARSAFGADWKWSGELFGLLSLEGAYVASHDFNFPLDFSNQLTTDQAFYVKGGVSLGPLTLNGNYRAIDPDFDNGVAGMSGDSGYYYFGMGGNGEAPFGPDNVGFGLDGSLKFDILNGIEVRFLYDSSSDFTTRSQTASTLSVGGTVGLFAGFSLSGWYNNTQVNNVQVSAVNGTQSGLNGNYNSFSYGAQDDRWSSGLGFKLFHDGEASNALIRGLNLNLAYRFFYNPASSSNSFTDFEAAASYSGKLAILSLNPFLRYHSFADSAASANTYDYNTLKGGITASTDPLDIPLKPSLDGAFASRRTQITRGSSNIPFEQFWRAGLTLNEFFASGSKLKVGYAQYRATNVVSPLPQSGAPARGFTGEFSSISNDRIFEDPSEIKYPWNLTTGPGTDSGGVAGLYTEWTYGNLTSAFGVFDLTDSSGNVLSKGTAFKVSYKVNF